LSPGLRRDRSLPDTDWGLVEAAPLSELEVARLKARQAERATVQPLAQGWRRPLPSWRDTLGWTGVALTREVKTWHTALPSLVRSDAVFSLMLWVAVFSVAAAVVAVPTIPVSVRYAAGLAAVAYLFLCVELTRIQRPVPGRQVLLGTADLAVVMALGALSAAYVPYAHVLLFFGAARLAARFRDPRILAAGLLLLWPLEAAGHAAPLAILMDVFLVLMTMWLVVFLTTSADGAHLAIARQGALAAVTSGLARSRDEEGLFNELAGQAPALAPSCAWAFWVKDPAGDEFRAVRWAGLNEGELPGFTFTPTLGADPHQPLLIQGPLPGTSFGECTLIQPTIGEDGLNGLITVAGQARALDAGTQRLVRALGDEMGATLRRLQTLDQERQQTEAMEQANRLAGLAAPHAADQRAALAAIRPALAELLRSESLHLEWVSGDRMQLIVPDGDPLQDHAPTWLPLAGTRTAEALLEGHGLREPLAGRRPEDLFGVPAGLRHIAVAPMRGGQLEGTLQMARRLPRAYAASELLVLERLAERLGVLLAAATPPASVVNSTTGGVRQ
jgi:hypothetical protein